MVIGRSTGRAADENRKRGADAFSGCVADLCDVRFDGWVETADLLADCDFHPLEFRANKFKGEKVAAGSLSRCGCHGRGAEISSHRLECPATPL